MHSPYPVTEKTFWAPDDQFEWYYAFPRGSIKLATLIGHDKKFFQWVIIFHCFLHFVLNFTSFSCSFWTSGRTSCPPGSPGHATGFPFLYVICARISLKSLWLQLPGDTHSTITNVMLFVYVGFLQVWNKVHKIVLSKSAKSFTYWSNICCRTWNWNKMENTKRNINLYSKGTYWFSINTNSTSLWHFRSIKMSKIQDLHPFICWMHTPLRNRQIMHAFHTAYACSVTDRVFRCNHFPAFPIIQSLMAFPYSNICYLI